MWNDIITLYIDETSLRLLVMRSQHIRKWADIHLESGLVQDGIVIDEIEVAKKIKQLFKDQDVHQKKVILGYSGLHALTRPANLPALPKAMLKEAVIREARRVLPVPLDQLYLSWCLLPGPKNRTQIFMAASPRNISDSLIKTVKAAGLNPSKMSIKPLAMTKTLPEHSAILIDMQPNEYDIVIVVEGVAQPIRTVTFPNGNLPWEKKIELVIGDLDRTIKFYNTNNPEKPLDVTTSVYVSGDLISQPDLQATLVKKSGRKVIPLATHLKGTEKLDIGRYMVNIAMALNSPVSEHVSTFPAANLNVLPTPYLPKPISLTKVIGIPAGVVVAGITVPMLITIQSSSSSISSLQSNLETTNQVTNQKIFQKQALKKTVTQMEQELGSIKMTYEKILLSVDSVMTQQEIVNGDIEAALVEQSYGISLKDIRESQGNMIINGYSPDENSVLSYARYLDNTGRFYSTTVSSFTVSDHANAVNQDPSQIIGFTITLQRKGN